jgi:Mg2+-importing ATPase
LPFTPVAAVLGFGSVPARFVSAMGIIVIVYVVAAEAAKRYFYRVPLVRL